MKKKLLITLCFIVLCALTLTGCGTEVANGELPNLSEGNSSDNTKDQSSQNGFFSEPNVSDTIVQLDQLKTDLAEFVAIFSDHSLEINDMEVVKRQTTVEDKTDVVFVSGTAVNEIAQHNFYYKMTYILYNDGWILDEVEKDDKNKCFSQPLKGPDEQQIYYDVESYYSDEYSSYDDSYSFHYQIEESYDDFSDGAYVFSVTSVQEYEAGKYITSDNWMYTFDDSKMSWEYDKRERIDSYTVYDLDGVWVGEDYSVEASLSNIYDLSTMVVTVTDLRSGEIVYSGTTKSSIAGYYANFLNRNRHPVRDIVTGEILYYDNYGEHENIFFGIQGVSYEPYPYATKIKFKKSHANS